MSKGQGRGIPAIDRLLSGCEDVDGCWIFRGATGTGGYARIYEDGRRQPGHLIAWRHFMGEWPDGMTYDHLCRTPSCVNPWHGDPVPIATNIRRGGNAIKTHCPQGHPYSGDNLRIDGRRYARLCRTCQREHLAAYYLRKRVTS
jgi:hypothetical protein